MGKKEILRIVFGALILLLSWLFWWVLRDSMHDGGNWTLKILFPSLVLLLLGTVLGLALLLENEKKMIWLLPVLVLAPFIFFVHWGWTAISLVILAILLVFASILAGYKEKSRRITLAPRVVMQTGLAGVLTGLALLSSLIFFWAPTTQALQQSDIIIPRSFFDNVAGPIFKALAGPTPAGMSPGVYQKAMSDSLDQVYDAFNQQLAMQGRAYKKFIPAGVAVSFFFAVKFWSFILMWPMMLLAWLAFKAMLWCGIIKINFVETKKEEIEIN